MESKVKTRMTPSVPSSVGRQIGVLPVGNPPVRPRRPKPNTSAYALPLSDSSRNRTSPASPHRGHRLSGRDPSPFSSHRGQRFSGRDHTPQEPPAVHAVEEDGIKFVDIPNKNKLSIRRRPPSGATKRDSNQTKGLDKADLNYVVTVPGRKSSGSRRGSAGSRPSSGSQGESVVDEDEVVHPYKTISEQDILDMNAESDPEKIYEINLYASDLTKISNLQKFRKLRVLDLSCNYITKIENLKDNRDIRELKLYGNKIQLIENLTSLPELSNLQLQHNKIKTIGKSLCQCTKIKTLNISSNFLMKIEAPELSCCSHMTVLDVSCNMVDSLAFVNYLPNLEELNASGNRIKTIDLSRCKKLQDIDLSENDIKDISGLKGLGNLLSLNISNNKIATIKPLCKLKSLKDFHASDNAISEVSFLPSYFPQLEILNLSRNRIVSFDEVCSLNSLEELSELFISGNPFSIDDGTNIPYMSEIQTEFPNLDILDGAHLKRPAHKGAPLMRPMSASSIITVRQVESQMRQMDSEMKQYEEDISKRFDMLRATLDKLPSEGPSSSRSSSRSVSQSINFTKSSSHSRIRDALRYASESTEDLEEVVT